MKPHEHPTHHPGRAPCRDCVSRSGHDAGGRMAGTFDWWKQMSITFPWPPKELSPNARTHWRKKAPITKAYKQACWALAMEAGVIAPKCDGRLHLWLTFYPPDRRHRDDDNMIASFKAGRDGLALALGVDDKRFVCHPFVSDTIGGMVKVSVTGGPTR